MRDFTKELFTRSLPREHGFEPLRVSGTLPPDLLGTLFRNGPGIFELGGRAYAHPFDGDGVVTGVRFHGGSAWGAARAVESAGLRDERRMGKILYGGAAPWWRRMLAAHFGPNKVTANTSVVGWQGRLLALNEGGGPIELDPHDLRTLGETNLGGLLSGAFSAHPHRVAMRRATYNIGLEYGPRTRMHLYELPDEGEGRRLGVIELERPTLVHDFAVTQTHFVFLVSPVRANLLRHMLQIGDFADFFQWRPEDGTEVLVVPIEAPDAAVRFATAPFFQWHFANAFDRDGNIVVDYVRFPDASPIAAMSSDAPNAPMDDARYHRAVIDLRKKTFTSEEVFGAACEFPRVHPEIEGLEHDVAWLARSDLRGIMRLDIASGRIAEHVLPAGQWASEPIFVPRTGARPGDERDGHVLVIGHDEASDVGFLAIYDGREIEAGPRASVWFDHYLTSTFHGSWFAAPSSESESSRLTEVEGSVGQGRG